MEEYLKYEKEIRARRMARKHLAKHRKIRFLQKGCDWHKPSIYLKGKYDEDYNFIEIPHVKYSKRSQTQWMKKLTNKISRQRYKFYAPKKGNHYRKNFDYWWTWI